MKCLSVAILMTLTVLSACATTPPKHSVKVKPDSQSKISHVTRIGIIADVCLFRDSLGDNDSWVTQESRSAAGHMLEATKTYLEAKGYQVSYAQAPFVGAFKSGEKLFKVCNMSGGKVMEKNPPLFESAGLAGNQEYREALLKIIPKIPASQASKSNPRDICCSSTEMKDAISTIARNTGGDATLFLIGHGAIVSAGKQITEGLASGLLTAALTLGTVSVSRYNVSFMDTLAVLVDNTTGEILWSNALRLKEDGSDKAFYVAEKWPKSILYHMPTKAAEKRNIEVESLPCDKPSRREDSPETDPAGGEAPLMTDK